MSQDLLAKILRNPSVEGKGFLRLGPLSQTMTGPDVKVFASSDIIKVRSNDVGEHDRAVLSGFPLADQLDGFIDILGDIFQETSGADRDTRSVEGIGFGEVHLLNPPFQFHNNDDVRPYNSAKKVRAKVGRVYNDYIRSNFPILAIEPGRQVFNKNILGLLGVNNDGSDKQMTDGASYLKGEKSNSAILKPFETLRSAISTSIGFLTGNGISASKFADFVNDIGRYSDFFDNMILEVATFMNLVSGNLPKFDTNLEKQSNLAETKANNEKMSVRDAQIQDIQRKINNLQNPPPTTADRVRDEQRKLNQSEIEKLQAQLKDLQNKPVDIIQIAESAVTSATGGFKDMAESLLKVDTKNNVDKGASYSYAGSPGSYSQFSGKQLNLFSILGNRNGANTFAGAIKSADVRYLPFVIQNDVTVSETFSNNLTQHPLGNSVNSKAEEAQMQNQGGGITQVVTPSNAKEVLQKFATGALKNMVAGTGLGGEMGYALAGNSRLQLPDVWQDSSYSRSYSISFTFFSPYGDEVSIFENVMTPLVALLSMALPLKIGKQSYMSPFVVRCHCPGIISVDYGIIESLSITRGDEKNDFSANRTVPRTVKVNMSIRDMMPNMVMTFDGGIFSILNATNTNFRNYLMSITGLGLSEKMNIMPYIDRIMKKVPTGLDQWVTKVVGLDFISNTGPARFVSNLVNPTSPGIDNSGQRW